MAKPDASLPTSDPRLATILRIAGELRDLPRADFRNRLKADLAAQSKELESVGGKPLFTHDDIEARLKQLEEQPNFIVHDVRAALSDLPDMSMRGKSRPSTVLRSTGSMLSFMQGKPIGKRQAVRSPPSGTS